MAQYCAFDDQEVVKLTKADREWGKSEDPPGTLYRHSRSSDEGVPGCGRRVLQEHQTYEVGDSDHTPLTEPQY